MKTTREEGMKRGEFLRSLGLSGATLMAYYCMGTTLTSCGSESDDPDPGTDTGLTGSATGSNISFIADLTNTNYSDLKTVGKFMVIGDVLVAFTASNGYVAVSKTCTHQGNELEYRSAQNDIYCNLHFSEFSLTGAVEEGPATTPIKAYKATISTDGNTLTVTA